VRLSMTPRAAAATVCGDPWTLNQTVLILRTQKSEAVRLQNSPQRRQTAHNATFANRLEAGNRVQGDHRRVVGTGGPGRSPTSTATPRGRVPAEMNMTWFMCAAVASYCQPDARIQSPGEHGRRPWACGLQWRERWCAISDSCVHKLTLANDQLPKTSCELTPRDWGQRSRYCRAWGAT
jgi:hypothetical protein